MWCRSKIFAALAVAGLFCTPATAEDLPAFKDFSSKRIIVGKPTAGKRIIVQIDPAAQAAYLADAPTVAAPQTEITTDAPANYRKASYDWYWTVVSPKLDDSAPGRLAGAMTALQNGPEGQTVSTPRLKGLQSIANAHGIDILKSTVGTNVSPALALAVISVESAGDIDAVSSAGASGLMQLIPATAERFGVADTSEPADNIKGGVAYLDWLMGHFDGDPLMVLAGYNAGEGAVKKHNGVPPFAETRDYVPKVLAAWTVARTLCITPPTLMTDGCVFASGG
jgi:soluble lytic murein transglycosylase-like protein